MRQTTVLTLIFLTAAPSAFAQGDTIAAPKAGAANYDPTMSAKEAVLANWELAAAGIRAGRIVGDRVVNMAETDIGYRALVQQAQFAQKTMVQRYNAALWITEAGLGGPDGGDALTAAVAAATAQCESGECTAERAAIRDSFARATEELDHAADVARAALDAREDLPDTVLMTEQLTLIADYLESGDWAEGFHLTTFGRDGEEVAARIVGTMSLWRNIEPYVGLVDPVLDGRINAASEQLLRTLRRNTRGDGALAPDGPELTEIRARAETLAAEFRNAAALFAA